MVLKATAPERLCWYGLIREPEAISQLTPYPIAQVIPRKPELRGQLRKQALLGNSRASAASDQDQAAEKTQASEEVGHREEKRRVTAPVKPVVIHPLL